MPPRSHGTRAAAIPARDRMASDARQIVPIAHLARIQAAGGPEGSPAAPELRWTERSADQTSLNSPSTVSSSVPPDAPPERAPAPAGSPSGAPSPAPPSPAPSEPSEPSEPFDPASDAAAW